MESLDFVSDGNPYKLDYLDAQNDMLAVWVSNEAYMVFKYKGTQRFFKDGNGVGEVWNDFEHNIVLEPVPTLSDFSEYNEQHVIELIVAKEFNNLREGCMQ